MLVTKNYGDRQAKFFSYSRQILFFLTAMAMVCACCKQNDLSGARKSWNGNDSLFFNSACSAVLSELYLSGIIENNSKNEVLLTLNNNDLSGFKRIQLSFDTISFYWSVPQPFSFDSAEVQVQAGNLQSMDAGWLNLKVRNAERLLQIYTRELALGQNSLCVGHATRYIEFIQSRRNKLMQMASSIE